MWGLATTLVWKRHWLLLGCVGVCNSELQVEALMRTLLSRIVKEWSMSPIFRWKVPVMPMWLSNSCLMGATQVR